MTAPSDEQRAAPKASEPPSRLASLATRIRFGLLGLTLSCVAATAAALTTIGYRAEQRELAIAQRERSRAAALQVEAYVDDLVRTMNYLARVRGLVELPIDTQRDLLLALTRHNSAFESVALLDPAGRVIAAGSAYPPGAVDPSTRSPALLQTVAEGDDFLGSAEIDPTLNSPVLVVALPARDRNNHVAGVLWARINLKFLSFIVAQLHVGRHGYAYVVDHRNRVVIREGQRPSALVTIDPARRALLDRLRQPQGSVGVYDGLDGRPVLGATAPVPNIDWRVAVELPLPEARASLYGMLRTMAVAITAATLLALALAGWFSSRLTAPLRRLTEASLALRRGALDVEVDLNRSDELGVLATTLSQTARKLQQLIANLKQSLEERALAERRAAFLAEASALLAESLDRTVILRQLARLIVRHDTDWCVIDVLEGGRVVQRAVVTHVDEKLDVELRPLEARLTPDWSAPHPELEVLRSGRPCLTGHVTGGPLPWGSGDEERRGLAARLGDHSLLIVPMIARDEVLGAILFGRAGVEAPYGDADLGWAQEIARRAAAAVDNSQLYQDAQRAIRTRETFISIASHELKTPLTPLMLELHLLLELAEHDDLSRLPVDEQVRILRKSERQVARLNRLVTLLLDVSSITGGRLTLSPEMLDLSELVAEVATQLRAPAEQSGSALRIDAPGPLVGRWDRLRLEQVVTNLVGNALKFGGGQPIDVTVSGNDTEVRLTVHDRGIGIAPGDQARIFDRFERAVSREHYGGLGLGLFITREIVEAHGGQISVSSEPGSGSTFTVQLPRQSPAQPRAAKAAGG